MAEPYRILALAGGGVRGIFQARLLQRLEERIHQPLASRFDLIAGTSTGAISAGCVAAGVQAGQIHRLFLNNSQAIFQSKVLAGIRRGPRYQVHRLEKVLKEELGNARLQDLSTELLILASTVENHSGKIFTRRDAGVSLVDAVLSSAAAPTYFAPRRIEGDQRAFYDGGLWANDPTAVAVAYAKDTLHVPAQRIRVLRIGTGRIQTGHQAEFLEKLTPFSLDSLTMLMDMFGSLQLWTVQDALARALGAEQVLGINPFLPRAIKLDDAISANRLLPALADGEFESNEARILQLLDLPLDDDVEADREFAEANPVAIMGLRAGNITRFIPSRRYYEKFRSAAPSITEYVATSQRSLELVSVDLMTGDGFEDITRKFESMLARPRPVEITVSLLDPENNYLMHAISGNFERTGDELSAAIKRTISRLRSFHAELGRDSQRLFHLHTHNTLPSASAIVIDGDEPTGVIQLETRAYKTPAIDAFGFEVGAGSDLYRSLVESYRELISDGSVVI